MKHHHPDQPKHFNRPAYSAAGPDSSLLGDDIQNSTRYFRESGGRYQPTRRGLLALLASIGCMTAGMGTPAWAQTSAAWAAIETRARGQTVYFNAWGGSEAINRYIQWVAGEVQQRHGVRLEHVKISDAADMVKRVRAEKAAGKTRGSVDLVWINGENFLTMKREGLLFGPFAEGLPGYALVDVQGKPTTQLDFSEPVDGLEAPWGMAQLTFMADSRRTPAPPREGEAHYVGVGVCGGCHAQPLAVWSATRHAKAYPSLTEKHKAFDLDCVGCHVTGYEKPGGSTVTHVGNLENVQCEACHGPGSKHVAGGGLKSAIVRKPDPSVCTGCHHEPHVERSWRVEQAWPKVLGTGHGAHPG